MLGSKHPSVRCSIGRPRHPPNNLSLLRFLKLFIHLIISAHSYRSYLLACCLRVQRSAHPLIPVQYVRFLAPLFSPPNLLLLFANYTSTDTDAQHVRTLTPMNTDTQVLPL
jgi:hypothetical protein